MKNLILPISEELLPYAYWLCNIKGVGRKTIYHLLTQIKSPKTVYELSEKELLPFLTERQKKLGLAERIMSSKENWDVQGNYQKLAEKHIFFTCLGHAAYPERLANIPDAPYGLYYIGRLPEHDKPSVAIIGARNCSEYGRYMAECYGRELAAAGVQIISGMARGIDGIGQKEALLSGGYSLGVMGCSVDICYPEENRELYNMLCAHGGICSEYSLNTEPQNTLFPPRNRIISAFSDIVLVIEARHRSGTLITVDMALEQGKEVYALPGRVTDPLSDGCNRLIQQGAGIAVSPQDMLRTLMGSGFKFSEAVSKQKQRSAGKNMFISAIQSEIIDVLDSSPLSVEMIKQRMLLKYRRDISIPELMNQLMKLSLYGGVRQVSNSYFMKE